MAKRKRRVSKKKTPISVKEKLKFSFSMEEKKPTFRVMFWKIGISINLFIEK